MSIIREAGRMQIACDHCPAAYPNTYAADEFDVMVSDAKAAGWSIRKKPVDPGRDRGTSDLFGRSPRIAGGTRAEGYIHACPACSDAQHRGSML